VAQLIHPESEDTDKDIALYSNSPGGDVNGMMAMYETHPAPALRRGDHLHRHGRLGGRGGGGRGCTREAIGPRPFSGHDPPTPLTGQIQGQATDIAIQAAEIMRMRESINDILAAHTGRELESVERDTDRDTWMTATDALDYGLIDQVLAKERAFELAS
jgi:ATP-dependent Clp protease protease subunit